MATRYSGTLTLRVRILDDGGFGRPAEYGVKVSSDGRALTGVRVGGARADNRAIDASNVYDDIARAALAFVPDDVSERADHDGVRFVITRTKETR